MRIWIENRLFELHLLIIKLFEQLRLLVGKINAQIIRYHIYKNNIDIGGVVKIHPWQLKLLKCVHAMDVYVVTGIYDVLMKDRSLCYANFGINKTTARKICMILQSNYKYNEQTMFYDKDYSGKLIERTWENYMPMLIILTDNKIVWTTERVTKFFSKERDVLW